MEGFVSGGLKSHVDFVAGFDESGFWSLAFGVFRPKSGEFSGIGVRGDELVQALFF